MNTWVASSTGSAPSRKRSAAGTPRLDARTSGSMSRNSFSRSGDRSPRSRSVGARSWAGSRRSRTSGSVLRANASSRRTVARVSRRKVGKTWNVSASASSREASAPKVASPPVIRPRSWPSSRETASNTRPVSRNTRRSATSCSASGRSRSAPPSKKGAALPSESLKSRANAAGRDDSGLVQPLLERRRACPGRMTRKTSSSSTVSVDVRTRQRPAVVERLASGGCRA